MGISTKNRRRIVYQGIEFFWWVLPEFDGEGNMLSLNIASEDKKFRIRYFLIREDPANNFMTVIGDYFPGLGKKSGHFVRVQCPPFKSFLIEEKGVPPRLVKEILDWCFAPSH